MDSSSSALSDQLKADFKRLYFRRTFNLDEKAAWLATFANEDTPACSICVQEGRPCRIRTGVSIRCESCSGIKRCTNVENFKRWIICSTLNIDDDAYNRVQNFFEGPEGAPKPSPNKIRVNESTRARTAMKSGSASDSDMPAHEDPAPGSHDSGSDTEASYPAAPVIAPHNLVPIRKFNRTNSAPSSATMPPRFHAGSPASSASSTPEPPSVAHSGSGGRGPCTTCGRTHSPMWRKGPLGPSTLCNACGLKYAKDPSLLNNVSRASAVPVTAGDRPRGNHGSRDIAGPCRSCNRKESPLWRRGPAGPKTLCNACGLRFVNHPETFGAHASGVPVRETTTKTSNASSASSHSAHPRPAAKQQRYTLSPEDEVLYLRRRNKELESEKTRHIRELEFLEAELDKANEGKQRMEVVKRVYEGRIRKLKAELSGGEDRPMEKGPHHRHSLPTPSHTDDSSDDSDTTFAAASAMLMLFKGKGKRSRFDTPSESGEDDETVRPALPPSKRRRMSTSTGPSMASFHVQHGAAAMAIA